MRKPNKLLAAAAGLTILAAIGAQPALTQERKSIRWATSSVDSYGYKVAAAMVKIAEEALGGEYTVTVNPYPATTAAMKAAMDGTGEIGYTADVGMTQLYAGEGGFKNYTPTKGMLVHTWYAYPMESFMAVPADKAAQYKCLKDLSGKPTFFTPAGFMNWLNFQRMYKALGYDFKHVQIDPKTQADALNSLAARPGVSEAVLVSTCNRTEVYCRADDMAAVRAWLRDEAARAGLDIEGHLYAHSEAQAIRHAFRVASGLDSMVLGEPQILGQVK